MFVFKVVFTEAYTALRSTSMKKKNVASSSQKTKTSPPMPVSSSSAANQSQDATPVTTPPALVLSAPTAQLPDTTAVTTPPHGGAQTSSEAVSPINSPKKAAQKNKTPHWKVTCADDANIKVLEDTLVLLPNLKKEDAPFEESSKNEHKWQWLCDIWTKLPTKQTEILKGKDRQAGRLHGYVYVIKVPAVEVKISYHERLEGTKFVVCKVGVVEEVYGQERLDILADAQPNEGRRLCAWRNLYKRQNNHREFWGHRWTNFPRARPEDSTSEFAKEIGALILRPSLNEDGASNSSFDITGVEATVAHAIGVPLRAHVIDGLAKICKTNPSETEPSGKTESSETGSSGKTEYYLVQESTFNKIRDAWMQVKKENKWHSMRFSKFIEMAASEQTYMHPNVKIALKLAEKVDHKVVEPPVRITVFLRSTVAPDAECETADETDSGEKAAAEGPLDDAFKSCNIKDDN
ncbi:hypothetical protein HDU85_002673 [Gaertneriomyces sp. JEL0708]|nr:hypothetical protein HDU85_002673 [Gaertneriomyces sp. JEL0708]